MPDILSVGYGWEIYNHVDDEGVSLHHRRRHCRVVPGKQIIFIKFNIQSEITTSKFRLMTSKNIMSLGMVHLLCVFNVCLFVCFGGRVVFVVVVVHVCVFVCARARKTIHPKQFSSVFSVFFTE